MPLAQIANALLWAGAAADLAPPAPADGHRAGRCHAGRGGKHGRQAAGSRAIAEFRAELPSGYAVATGGTIEDSAKAQISIFVVFPFMLFLMMTILMVQLMSFQRLLLVLLTAPLALIGVAAALLVSGAPMGFVAILGVISLIGMVIRNSVILIVQIDEHIAAGEHPWSAVISATEHRLRPDPAHRRRGHPWHDPDRTDRVLGTDGVCGDGRTGGGDPADAGVPAGALRDVVPHYTTGQAGGSG